MSRLNKHSFHCIDGHTCGNPVRMVVGGAPKLKGQTMADKRQDFLAHHDWVRTSLMFEPRGHDLMSGTILYQSQRDDCDMGVLYIETSGCLPMCGHGTIGTVTFALEGGYVKPESDGLLRLETPAGRVDAHYQWNGDYIDRVKIHNIASFLAATEIILQVPELGEFVVDVAYGGNFYAIIEPQKNYQGLDQLGLTNLQRLSPIIRNLVNDAFKAVHPEDSRIHGVTHLLWADRPKNPDSDARNAVFYGDRAIDRSPCGTGTSARMAQLAAKGQLKVGESFVHESIIGSQFTGTVEAAATVGDNTAIMPSIAGWARQTGNNTIYVDNRDPFKHGFVVT